MATATKTNKGAKQPKNGGSKHGKSVNTGWFTLGEPHPVKKSSK